MSEVIQRQRRALKDYSVDAIIACSPKNIAYTIGFTIPSHPHISSRQAMSIVTQDVDVLLLVQMEEQTAKNSAKISRILSYMEFEEKPMEALANLLTEMGLASSKVAIESGFLPAQDYFKLKDLLPGCTFVSSDEILNSLRVIKTPEEIRRLRKVVHIADSIHNDVYGMVSAGCTERKLGGLIVSEFLNRGGDNIAILVVASGDRSGLPNGSPTDKVIRPDEIVRVDILGTYESYYSDIARTVYVGTPGKKHEDTWKRIYDTHQQLLDMVKPGVNTSDIYAKFKKCFDGHGFPVSNFVGHGVGVDLHEAPLIGKYGGVDLEENMVICIEPFIFHGREGYHVEDQLLITANGYEKLSNVTCTEEMLRIKI